MTAIADIKQTPLSQLHLQAGAKMVPFAGWHMPLQFSKVAEEHQAVRQAAGLFDIGHMGQIVVSAGSTVQVLEFLDTLVPQNLQVLYPGKAVYTQLLNQSGGIIDDIIIYDLPEETLPFEDYKQVLVICNASNTQTVLDWLAQHQQNAEVAFQLVSKQYSLFALQGPKFSAVLNALGIPEGTLPKRFHIGSASLNCDATTCPVLLCRTGYTGEDGVEIIVSNQQAPLLWQALMQAGQPVGLLPVGLAARDTLRLEAAYPLHGHDISVNDTPLEAGLGWSVKLDKPVDFIGKAALLSQKQLGLPKKMYCLKFDTKVIPRQHCAVLVNNMVVGEVTSGSISLSLGYPIAMAYITAGSVLQPGDSVMVEIRGKKVQATITKRPFYVS